MTPAGQRWSRNKPTVPGWYWWRRPGEEPTIAQVRASLHEGLFFYLPENEGREGSISVSVAWPDTEWQGPITPHDQEAG